jgi:hypothetical protein
MSVLDLGPTTLPVAPEEKIPEKQTENSGTEQTKQTTPYDEKSPTVLFEGPLSNVYTKALDVIYGKDRPDVVTESEEEDTELDYSEINDYEDDAPADYIYVTNSDKLDSSTINATFESILKATKNPKFSSTSVCIETNQKHINNSVVILEEFLTKSNIRVFYTRESLINHLLKK